MSWENLQSIKEEFLVDSATRQERVDHCSACEHLNMVKTCAKCNCFMPVKTWIKFASCPIGKWPATNLYIEPEKDSNNE